MSGKAGGGVPILTVFDTFLKGSSYQRIFSGTEVPTPHLQLNGYQRMTPNGMEVYQKAKQDALPMTKSDLQKIWSFEDAELIVGTEGRVTFDPEDPDRGVLQQIVDREGEGMGTVVGVTFLLP